MQALLKTCTEYCTHAQICLWRTALQSWYVKLKFLTWWLTKALCQEPDRALPKKKKKKHAMSGYASKVSNADYYGGSLVFPFKSTAYSQTTLLSACSLLVSLLAHPMRCSFELDYFYLKLLPFIFIISPKTTFHWLLQNSHWCPTHVFQSLFFFLIPLHSFLIWLGRLRCIKDSARSLGPLKKENKL